MEKIMKHCSIPGKIVCIILSLHNNTTSHVLHNATPSAPFSVNAGVRQGCLLSPIRFSLVMDWVMRTAISQPQRIQWSLTSKLEDLDYVDDVAPLSHIITHAGNTDKPDRPEHRHQWRQNQTDDDQHISSCPNLPGGTRSGPHDMPRQYITKVKEQMRT